MVRKNKQREKQSMELFITTTRITALKLMIDQLERFRFKDWLHVVVDGSIQLLCFTKLQRAGTAG
jgi:hypothetical protein